MTEDKDSDSCDIFARFAAFSPLNNVSLKDY